MISEPLAYYTKKDLFGPIMVIKAIGNALIIAKIKFRKIPMEMLFLAMLIYALHTTFEDGEKAFHVIGVNSGIGQGNIFPLAMLDAIMLRKMFIQESILPSIIGHNPGFMGDILFQDRDNGFGIEAVNNHAAGFTGFPVNKRQNLTFMSIPTALGHTGFIPEKSFINFNSTTIGAKRSQFAFSHGFTDTVSHKPGSFESNPKGSMKLMRANAFLGSTHKVDGLEP
ncbi:MAG: hypothetical protein A2Z73_00170 [Deltaproteobacteria bacterium RBG_13_60_28]|nr:MAG: hypothetical protein A2Z73_00170 [Deltaproteobacteria bacterium RBG_13_60_28]